VKFDIRFYHVFITNDLQHSTPLKSATANSFAARWAAAKAGPVQHIFWRGRSRAPLIARTAEFLAKNF
jgi:hypothetical protein